MSKRCQKTGSHQAILAGLIFLFCVSAPAGGQPPARPAATETEAKQGEVLWVTVEIDQPDAMVSGKFQEHTIPFFKIDSFKMGSKWRYGGLIGIDLAEEPAVQDLVIEIQGPSGQEARRQSIKVTSSPFKVEELTVPREHDALDEETLRRVRKERARMVAKLSGVSLRRFWEGPFLVPVSGRISGNFGSKRVINGQPRNPHNGEDIAAPTGTPVMVSNHGVVILTGDFFFSGKGILVDHGLSLFTMYFHLSKILVKEGESVIKGQTIGQVGATGRATGPHLHWGARLNTARIDPFSLTRLPLGQSP